MKALPARYLYLASAETDRVFAVFSVEELDREADVIAYEARLREQYGVDEPGSRLVLKDSLLSPLAEELDRLEP
jgi:hypothetical protein